MYEKGLYQTVGVCPPQFYRDNIVHQVNYFNSFNNIEVDIINSIIEGNQAAVQINIQLDDISLKVMDAISFTDTSITKIDAYKQ